MPLSLFCSGLFLCGRGEGHSGNPDPGWAGVQSPQPLGVLQWTLQLPLPACVEGLEEPVLSLLCSNALPDAREVRRWGRETQQAGAGLG